MAEDKNRAGIIEVIGSPLGFFVLALLIVEGFLTLVLTFADIDKTDKVNGMYFGIGLFVFVVFIVAIFSWKKPENLTFDKIKNWERWEIFNKRNKLKDDNDDASTSSEQMGIKKQLINESREER